MLERILRFSIDQRWLVVLVTAAAALLGVYSLTQLPIDAVPDITNNQVQINTEYEALGPEQVEKQITFPVETALAGIEGLDYTRSISRNGFSQVTAVFTDATDVYFARSQVLERLVGLGETLPPGAEPTMGAISTGLGEVFMYAVEYENPGGVGAEPSEDGLGWQPDGGYLTPEGEVLRTPVEKAAYLRTLQEYTISPQLRQVANVAGVDAIGGYEKQYGVEPDPMKLVGYGLSFADLIDALEAGNVAQGAKYIETAGEALQVRASGLLTGVEDIAGIVIGESDGVPVRVSDVATVGVSREVRYGSASLNGEEAVIGTALMLIGGNSRQVAADVGAKLEEIGGTLPAGIAIRPVLDRTGLVDKTIATVEHNLFFGAILVIVVLFALLGNLRAAPSPRWRSRWRCCSPPPAWCRRASAPTCSRWARSTSASSSTAASSSSRTASDGSPSGSTSWAGSSRCRSGWRRPSRRPSRCEPPPPSARRSSSRSTCRCSSSRAWRARCSRRWRRR